MNMPNEFNVGDRVTYYNPEEEDHGIQGIVESIKNQYGQIRYKIHWETGSDDASHEAATQLRHFRRESLLDPEMAENIATYLALDSVEDPGVASWVQALQNYARH